MRIATGTFTAALCLGLGAGVSLARGPFQEETSGYRPNNPFLEGVATGSENGKSPSAAGASDEGIWPSQMAHWETSTTNPGFPNVAQTTWQSPASGEPTAPPPPAPAPAAPPPASASDSGLDSVVQSTSPWNPAPPRGISLEVPGESEYPTVNISGFVQMDSVIVSQTDGNKQVLGDIPNGAAFPRARLGVTGEVYRNVGYKLEMDFARGGHPSFFDVYAEFREIPWLPGTLRIGRWKLPFGMSSAQSARELFFLERPMPQAFVPFRQIGIGLLDPNTDDNLNWGISGFRFPTGPFGNNTGDSGSISMTTRVTRVFGAAPGGDPLLHIGGDYSFFTSSLRRFSVATRPEIGLRQFRGVPSSGLFGVPPFVDTGTIPGPKSNLFGLELASRKGSLWAQGEVYFQNIDQSGAPNPTFWGGYLMAGYVLTGEIHPYSKAHGALTRVVPNRPVTSHGGIGAWEIVGRISTIDLTDANITGGRCTNLAGGLNWYVNPRTKFQFNIIHPFLERGAVGDSQANVLAARCQVDF